VNAVLALFALSVALVALAAALIVVVYVHRNFRETRRQEARTYRALARTNRANAEMATVQGRSGDAANHISKADKFDAQAADIEQKYGRARQMAARSR
jgi:hypothetical protein